MANQDTSQAVAVRGGNDLAQLDELDRILRGGDFNVEVVDDPESISKQIVAELLAATNDDELEFMGEAEGWSEYEGVPFQVDGFHWRPSDYENSAIYLVVFVRSMVDGERKVLTTGSLNITAQLSNLARRGKIPGCVRVLTRSEKPTKGGFHPHMLMRTPEEIEATRAAESDAA